MLFAELLEECLARPRQRDVAQLPFAGRNFKPRPLELFNGEAYQFAGAPPGQKRGLRKVPEMRRAGAQEFVALRYRQESSAGLINALEGLYPADSSFYDTAQTDLA